MVKNSSEGKETRRQFLGIAPGGTGRKVAAGVVLSLGGWGLVELIKYLNNPPTNDSNISPQSNDDSISSLEKIAFQEAVSDPSLRQTYLNQIYEGRNKYGGIVWNSFLSIEYDPKFKRLEEKRNQMGLPSQSKSMYRNKGNSVALANSMWLYPHGQKNHTWISDDAFKYCKTEDDLFSLLDNEASSTYLRETGNIHIRLPQPSDPDVMVTAVELLSFDYQFTQILNGRRKVSADFMLSFIPPAKELFSYFKDLSTSNHPDNLVAKSIVDTFRSRPTIQYFE